MKECRKSKPKSLLYLCLIAFIFNSQLILAQGLQSKVLFEGELGDQWLELATSGGDFAKFVQIKEQKMVVDVPAGNARGKTGIRSANALFKIPNESENTAIKLSFTVDSEQSTDFVFAIIPSNWDGKLEWRSHLIRLQVNKNDDNTATLSLRIKTTELMKTAVDLKQIQQLNLIIRSDKIVTVTDKNNNFLLQALMGDNARIYPDGYKISVLTYAKEKNLPAKLTLKKISLEEVKYNKETETSLVSNKEGKTVLFNGHLLGHRWKKYQEADADYDEATKFTREAMFVDVPKNSKLANIGIQSNGPVIWLDQFGEGSKREVVFDFLPAQTTGFAIALSNSGNHFIVKWVKDSSTDTGLLQIYLSQNLGLIGNWHSSYKPVWEQKVTAQPPSQLILTLTPKGVSISGNNLPEHLQVWEFLKANAGYEIYAYSFPLSPDQAVKLALKQISLNTIKLVPLPKLQANQTIEPLPTKIFFDGSKVQDWTLTPWAIYKKPVDSCHLDTKGFSVFDVPPDTPLDGCDIHTTEPLFTLDERIEKTNYTVIAEFDAKTTKNFQVVLTPHSRNKWNKYYEACYIQLFQNKQSKNIFSLNCGGNKRYWHRQVSEQWLNSQWDGKLSITIEQEWLIAQLGNGQSIRIAHKSPSNIYTYIVALDYHYKYTNTAFRLKKLTGQWQAPEGMKSVERWFFIDKSDFNPEQFIKDLASDLPYPSAPVFAGEENEQ